LEFRILYNVSAYTNRLIMKSKKSSFTIEDVAREAGVSIATVSRVINATGVVLPETIERVQKVIQEFNYVPRTAARILARQRTDTTS